MSKDSLNSVINHHTVKAEFLLVDAAIHAVAKRSWEMMDETKFPSLFFCCTTATLDICTTSNGFTEKGPTVSPLCILQQPKTWAFKQTRKWITWYKMVTVYHIWYRAWNIWAHRRILWPKAGVLRPKYLSLSHFCTWKSKFMRSSAVTQKIHATQTCKELPHKLLKH